MTLYSGVRDSASHRTRIVLAEKNITVDIVDVVDGEDLPEDLIELNPYNSVPTLVDRDLALYDSQVIMEYLDERYPHPPLMPVDPVARARSRIYLYRIERDWYSQLEPLESGNGARREEAKKTLRDSLTVIAPIFEQKPFFMSDEFSMVDCCVAPILWRLKHYDIDLPAQAKSIQKYAERLFTRDSFQASLTDAEREMHRI
jgi:RNA polymerase-associated protein